MYFRLPSLSGPLSADLGKDLFYLNGALELGEHSGVAVAVLGSLDRAWDQVNLLEVQVGVRIQGVLSLTGLQGKGVCCRPPPDMGLLMEEGIRWAWM